MVPCVWQTMNTVPGDCSTVFCRVLTASFIVLFHWNCYTHPARRNRRTARPTPQTDAPHSTQKTEPLSEKGEPLTCSPYKQSGGSSGFSPPRPAFSLQREYFSVVARRGPRGGSWSGLPWLSYTSRGREPKIRFLA